MIMGSVRVLGRKNDWELLEPLNRLDDSFGYYMIVNPKGQVVKFYPLGNSHEARKYFEYKSLTKWEKFKYWWDGEYLKK